ncbi:MAG: heavy metal translocating P-type ATPase, partial [Verrucomicrobia bacterium]|nr:heavy metal translocating P-type ATPase [Verrucomicrobiota bacterium]
MPHVALRRDGKVFCCAGCLAVFELLSEHGLADFYHLGGAAGIRIEAPPQPDRFAYLDEASVRERFVDFADARSARVTFRAPSIHCVGCVWLLENLFRLKPGIGRSEVNFLRREVSITFDPRVVRLSEVADLLASVGYAPELNLADLDRPAQDPALRRCWLQLGVAGFAFGNIMLFSIPSYLGLDRLSGPAFRELFGWLSLGLALPVVGYSAADYWRAAWLSARRRALTLEVPIAAGLAALFAQSAWAVVSDRGVGYWDSLVGLVFFLLCGRWFQQRTYARLAFDRDYRSFFPLSVTRRAGAAEERVALSCLRVGDRLVIRNGELIPADARLVGGAALIDYSFVTGESEPVAKTVGEHLYAGGRQTGGRLEIETVKPVSQGYLAALWGREEFDQDGVETLDTVTDRYGRWFAKAVIAVALGAAVAWGFLDPSRSLRSFTAVLIVACPCALAMAAPFALGTARGVLARRGVFVRSPGVFEAVARVDTVVFDKTGTLTTATGAAGFEGAPLASQEAGWLAALSEHSNHPYAVRIRAALAGSPVREPVEDFGETAGCGIEGWIADHEVWMGSAKWLRSRGAAVPAGGGGLNDAGGTAVNAKWQIGNGRVHVAIDGRYRGHFMLTARLRPEVDDLIGRLAAGYQLALLSGDNARERTRFIELFGESAHLCFDQSPVDKLEFIRRLQGRGGTVMMVGDGLNDAGALKRSDVGVGVVESLQQFSPASDVILAADRLSRL